ncbi:MAG: HAD family hydrolase [Candidatus Aminicenantales bacterium]
MSQRNKERLIFWDWTGTLANESRLDAAVCAAIEKAISRRQRVSLSEARNRFQNYLRQLEGSWQWHDYLRHARLFNLPWEKIQELHLDKLSLLPGAREALSAARELGFRNLLATNAVRAVVNVRLNYLGITDLFDAVIASDDVAGLKASGLHFRHGLKLFAADPRACFSVGDNPVQDIAPARRLQIKTIYCPLGQNYTHYHTTHLKLNHQETVQADFVISSLAEIKKILASTINQTEKSIG